MEHQTETPLAPAEAAETELETEAEEAEFTIEDEAAWLVLWAKDRLEKIDQVRGWLAERYEGRAVLSRMEPLKDLKSTLEAIVYGERSLARMLRSESPEAVARKAERARAAERARTFVFPAAPQADDDVCVLGERTIDAEFDGITYRFRRGRTVSFVPRELAVRWNNAPATGGRFENLGPLPDDLLARLQEGGRHIRLPAPGKALGNVGDAYGLVDPQGELDTKSLMREAGKIVAGCGNAEILRHWRATALENGGEPDTVLAAAIEQRLDDLGEPLEAPDEEADETDGDEPEAPEAAE